MFSNICYNLHGRCNEDRAVIPFFYGVLNPITGLRPVHCKYCMLPPFLSICIAVSMSLDDSFFPLPCKVILTYSSVCLSL